MQNLKKIAVFVHDYTPFVGHSNAMMETIKSLPQNFRYEIHVVSFTFVVPVEYSPTHLTYIHHKIPISNLRPTIVKIIWYYLVSFFYLLANKVPRNSKRISVGLAYPFVDIFNIQFIHKQWYEICHSNREPRLRPNFLRKIYLLFLNFMEKKTYKQQKGHFLCLSKFCADYLKQEYSIDESRLYLAYSGVNKDRFDPTKVNRQEALNILTPLHPELQSYKPGVKTALFIGAFERKGLDTALNWYSQQEKEVQFICVGVPSRESVDNNFMPESVIWIKKTSLIEYFYQISDLFIFPTFYEPFGLVILEAFAMGNAIIVSREQVGASEILYDQPDVFLVQNFQDFPNHKEVTFLTDELRCQRYESRRSTVAKLDWSANGNILGKLIDL